MKKAMQNKKGFTLVELIVTFALISIFIGAAAVLVSSAIRVHTRVTNITRVQTIADMMVETIIGEVSGALDIPLTESFNQAACYIEKGSDGKDKLLYTDKYNNLVTLYVGTEGETDGLLKLHYNDQAGDDWFYGPEIYMNHVISKLQFEQLNGENLIRVTLGLYNKATGYEYEMSRIIQCYNLSGEAIESSAQ